MEREPYPSDLSDGQWVLIEPMITAWEQRRVERSATKYPGTCDLRQVVNAIFYQNRTGCQWRYLPHDLPAWSTRRRRRRLSEAWTVSLTGLDGPRRELTREAAPPRPTTRIVEPPREFASGAALGRLRSSVPASPLVAPEPARRFPAQPRVMPCVVSAGDNPYGLAVVVTVRSQPVTDLEVVLS
ncbi:transposase [Streptomyces sp. Edi4]|uniref:transposase n=1 Tax=Streptomyces sp. Edi4 TaxID=3162527 RepID=UPI003305F429